MAMHNNASKIEKALASFTAQSKTKRALFLIISDDSSNDESLQIARRIQANHPNIILLENKFNSTCANRNWLQDYVIQNYPGCVLMGRLDADDTLAEPDIVQRIESLWDNDQFDVLLMANSQIKNGQPTGYVNRPNNDLLNNQMLIQRLEKMANGYWEAELPSCNVFVRPQVAVPYETINSAEDHWNLVKYLLMKDELKINIEPEWIYCNYHIDGALSDKNRETGDRKKSRIDLFKNTLKKLEESDRKTKAMKVLQKHQPGNYSYLGAGFSGVVFHDESLVYKVHIPLASNNYNEIDNILYLKEKLRSFDGRKHFFALKDIIKVEDLYILIYPYKKGERVTNLIADEMISFLTEMWEMKLISRSITKENNFIRVDGIVKLIDYEIEPYSDNLFLNLAARAFIQLSETNLANINYNKLKRSTINQFQIPELAGFPLFLEKVFINIAEKQFLNNLIEHKLVFESNNVEAIHYDGEENPSVGLLIKACIQDSANLYNDINFIVNQLPKRVVFKERILLLDTYKQFEFTRQYTDKGRKAELIRAAKQLVKDGIIHRLILPPDSEKEIEKINYRCLGEKKSHTHSIEGVPITSQLFAFEQINCDYILQMDEDVLLGKLSDNHDFLQKPIEALQTSLEAVTWGFQIFQGKESKFQPIWGEDRKVPPDPRFCLIDKKRLIQQFPLENQSQPQGWKLTWYRALEKQHKSNSTFSLRGGDTDTFYCHIQNYRKENRWVWWTIMDAFRNNRLPEVQCGLPEVSGNIFDWTVPKRKETLVVILLLEDKNSETAKKTVLSILSQNSNEHSLIVYNISGDSHLTQFLHSIPEPMSKRITLIQSEYSITSNEAIYKAIHYYLPDEKSFVCLMKQGDLLLGNTVFSECLSRLNLYESDMLIGKEFSTFTFSQNGMSATDFLNPRQNPETLLNGLIIFRKYLFDALSHFDLKEPMPGAKEHLPGYTKVTRSYCWLQDNTSLSIMVPLVELSKNPIRFDHYNVFRFKISEPKQIKRVKKFLQSKPSKIEGKWDIGRKTFLPNQNRIELDITYECNLKCLHCNRSCTQAPTQTHMTLDQIQRFVRESIKHNKKWEIINVLGGEPTLHPEFEDIINCLLYEYVIAHSANTTLQITSNGYGDKVQSKLKSLPQHPNVVINTNSFKTGREIPYFTPFNLAPVDHPVGQEQQYHKGCWVTAYCGIGLNHLGYFACGVAGGIERILKAKKGIQTLEDLSENLLQNQLQTYCKLCGNFSDYAINRGDFMERAEKDTTPKTAMSETWDKLYKQHNNERG